MASNNDATSCDSLYFVEFGSINKITFIHFWGFERHPKSHHSVSSEILNEIESPSSDSAQHIATNEDILTEILLHLPPKSLLRFQTVSKNWLSIISSPLFRRLHTGDLVWRHSTECYDCNEYGAVDFCCDYGVFWNGAVHRVTETGPFFCFEIGNCSFRSMPTTPIPEEQSQRNIEYFGESVGHLHLIGQNSHQSTKFDIFELEVDYSAWFVKYHVNLDFLPKFYPAMVNPPEEYAYSNVFSTICFLEDEKYKARLLLGLPGKIILYDFGNGTIKELADVKPASLSC